MEWMNFTSQPESSIVFLCPVKKVVMGTYYNYVQMYLQKHSPGQAFSIDNQCMTIWYFFAVAGLLRGMK